MLEQMRISWIVGLMALVLSASPNISAQTTLFNGVEVPGVVIAHSPASSEKYISCPAIAILPNGDYVASHNIFGPNTTDVGIYLTRVYRSTDKGQTWSHAVTLNHLQANLFVHNQALYMLGAPGGRKELTIRKSTNGGLTWTSPTNSTNGILLSSSVYGYHTSSVPMVVHDGRIWRAYEDNATGGDWPGQFRAAMMSAPIGSDLLNAASWTHTNALASNPSWLPGNDFRGWLESNAVVDRNGQVVNVIRVDVSEGKPEKAAIIRSPNLNTLTFNPGNDIIDMPGGTKKFTIRYSPAADKYLTVASIVNEDNYDPNRKPERIRNIMALLSSDNLESWTVEQIIVQDLSDVSKIGFQYMDWQFDGSDIVIVSRTAYPDGLGGAHNFHDANFMTFHRVSYSSLLTPGDANADGMVTLADLQILGDHWLSGSADWNQADFNGDGVVNLADLQILGDHWGSGTTLDIRFDQALQQSGLAVPEPGALCMLVAAASGLILRR
ncbi:MAG: exo-alpha-sialidase [Phycisphaeraceae bacterium]|nr:exo-alpha-sialidase [Phycisphaeraceae bacterium]